MATAYIDPILPWLAIQNQNHTYNHPRSRPGSASIRHVRVWNQSHTGCSRKSYAIPAFYRGSYDASLCGVDSKIRLNPLGGRPHSASSTGSRRRLVPAVVGFDEEPDPIGGAEEAWQRKFEQTHSRSKGDDGSETSYVNFVRSYQGSSSGKGSGVGNGKHEKRQAWLDDKSCKESVNVPFQSPTTTRRSSQDDQNGYEITATMVVKRSDSEETSRSPTDQAMEEEEEGDTIIKPAAPDLNAGDLLSDAPCMPGGTADSTPQCCSVTDRSVQSGAHGSVTDEGSYELERRDRSGITTCDKGIQTLAQRLGRPPSVVSDIFQKENREESLRSRVQGQQGKLSRKQRKTSGTVEIIQPKFKEIPDFNMANWVQSRILVSAQSARYELPMDMHVLANLSPLEYLTEYAIICKRRQALYKLIFSKYDKERKNFLRQSQAIAGLKEIHLGSATDKELISILRMLNLDDQFKIDFRFFCSIAAFSERVLARWVILPGGALTEKETIEKADFTNLSHKLEGVKITSNMHKVLFAL